MLRAYYTSIVLVAFLFLLLSNQSHSNPFSPFVVIDSIQVKGNQITKRNIILRELMFHEKDTLVLSDLAENISKSRENLLNTSLFNFVTIDTVRKDSLNMNVKITVVERWYIWPFPIFELADRNFNVWWKTKDFSRTDYGVYIVKDNFRGRRESLKFKFQMGYNEDMAFSYTIPYINKKQTVGMGIVADFNRNHETTYATANNEQVYYKEENTYTRERFSQGIRLTYRKNLRAMHYWEVKYNFASVSTPIVSYNPDYFLNSASVFKYFSVYYKFEYDQRDSKYYPMLGYYVALDAMKNGLGIIGDYHLNADYILLNGKYYSKINKRFYTAWGIKGKISVPGKPSYFLQRALGYSDYVRGYDYYVIDGQHYALAKSELRFVLVPTQVTKIPFIKTEKFKKIHYTIYLNGYVDAGYVCDKYYYVGNSLTNTFLLGAGISLNYVTYYDKVLGIDYSINKMKETGIFLHYIAPI